MQCLQPSYQCHLSIHSRSSILKVISCLDERPMWFVSISFENNNKFEHLHVGFYQRTMRTIRSMAMASSTASLTTSNIIFWTFLTKVFYGKLCLWIVTWYLDHFWTKSKYRYLKRLYLVFSFRIFTLGYTIDLDYFLRTVLGCLDGWREKIVGKMITFNNIRFFEGRIYCSYESYSRIWRFLPVACTLWHV